MEKQIIGFAVDKLNELQKAYEISNWELCKAMDMRESAISRIKNKKVTPSLHTIKRFALVFDRPERRVLAKDLIEENLGGMRGKSRISA